MSTASVVALAVSIFGGLVVGVAFFALLRLNVSLYTSRQWPIGIALHFGRWAFLIVALLVAAHAGALPLLSVAAGTLVARMALIRTTPEATP